MRSQNFSALAFIGIFDVEWFLLNFNNVQKTVVNIRRCFNFSMNILGAAFVTKYYANSIYSTELCLKYSVNENAPTRKKNNSYQSWKTSWIPFLNINCCRVIYWIIRTFSDSLKAMKSYWQWKFSLKYLSSLPDQYQEQTLIWVNAWDLPRAETERFSGWSIFVVAQLEQ